jgi:MHS family proline/betaine transporter-like MFS transporter
VSTTTLSTSRRGLDTGRAVAAASIGNALEWFDFVVYGFFAATIAKLFFPTGSETISLLLALGTFGVTFLMRPLGAVVLGAYADRHGRKEALALTIGLMMIGTAIIAFAPTYAAIGIGAPVLIVLARLIQGFSAGGEFGSATAFLAEQNPERRGFFASWQFASQGITTVLATAFGATLTAALTTEQMEGWGWRIPFIFGLVIGPVAYYIRKHLDEPAEFRAITASQAPLRDLYVDGRLGVLIGLGAIVLGTVAMYTILFMPTYATRQLGLAASGSFFAVLLTGALQIVLIPIVGALSDRIGRLPIAFAAAIAFLVTIYPLFAWLAAVPTLTTLLIVQVILGVMLAGYMGGLPALMSELFPTRMRTTGLSISYSFGVAIFGGFAPFISVWLISVTGSKLAPSFYLMLAAVISLAALTFARRLGFR